MQDTVDIHQAAGVKLNPIPPWNRIAVDAKTASHMMSCGYSTFFQRIRQGQYPKAGPDGHWSVNALRAVHQSSEPTRP